MNIKKIKSVYFSPNGSTKEIVNILARSIGNNNVEEINLTSVESRNTIRTFKEDELVIIGFPVYADRLPIISDEVFKNVNGYNTPTVIIVSYGNRDYGDALLELKNRLAERGFKIIAGAAAVGEHCLNTSVAHGRPDENDNQKMLEFGSKILERIESIKDINKIKEIEVKGKYPFHPLKSQHTPAGDSKCIQCGRCQENCPVNAIVTKNYRETDSDKCIFCGKCIQVCPTHARDVKEESFLSFMKKLETIASKRREIEVFL